MFLNNQEKLSGNYPHLQAISYKDEEWKLIEEFPMYAVSNQGRVKRLFSPSGRPKNKILKPTHTSDDQYPAISFSKKSKRKMIPVHRLVARAFIGECPKGYEVNHKNGNKRDPTLVNLEYVTRSQNKKHAFEIGLITKKKPEQKLTPSDINQIRALIVSGLSNTQISKIFKVHSTTICNIKRHKRSRNVTGFIMGEVAYS